MYISDVDVSNFIVSPNIFITKIILYCLAKLYTVLYIYIFIYLAKI